MLNYSYYPFINPLSEVDAGDLSLLREIPESWHIEYKQADFGQVKDYAKQISAFANQNGGWLFIGIRENDDKLRTAGEFVGLDSAELEKVSLKVREAASNINPSVLYEDAIIRGPIESIGLAQGKAIFIVGVPKSYNTPHIHPSGQIYRRVGDQSTPKAETDRFILDELWKRRKENDEKTTKRLTKIPELPEELDRYPWAHIFIRPCQSQKPTSEIPTLSQFDKIVTNSDKQVKGFHAPLDSIQGATYGFIAKQLQPQDPALPTLTLRWWHDGTVRFDIPLNQYQYPDLSPLEKGNKYYGNFLEVLVEKNYNVVDVIDYSSFVSTLVSLSNIYLHICREIGDTRDHFSCFTLKNILRTAPYVDSDKYIERVKKYSLPLCEEKNIVFPLHPTEESMFKLDPKPKDIDDVSVDREAFVFCSPLVYSIFTSVGIAPDVESFAFDYEAWGFHKLY